MKKRLIAILLVLAMAVSACIGLASCNNEGGSTTTDASPEQSTEATTEATTEDKGDGTTEATTTPQTDDGSVTESDNTTEVTTEITTEATTEDQTEIYENGEELSEAGAQWESGEFAATENTVDQSAAQSISASTFISMLEEGTLEAGKVYAVSGKISLPSNATVNGKGAAIVAPDGVFIKDSTNLALSNLIIVGVVNITKSQNVKLENIDIQSHAQGTALKIDANSSNIIVDSFRVSAYCVSPDAIGHEVYCTAIVSEANSVYFYEGYVTADTGFELSGDDSVVHSCHVVALNSGIVASGKTFIARSNTIEVSAVGVGIKACDSYNGLIALNAINNAQSSIVLEGGFNTAVVLNSAISISTSDFTNLYIVDNSLGGKIEMSATDYLICDGNKFSADGKDHPVSNTGASNFNGNNVTDVDLRAEVGAEESILPHTNKDLFINMQKQNSIVDLSLGDRVGFTQYVNQTMLSKDIVIVPPGYYTESSPIVMSGTKNKQIYAYGVYYEYPDYNYVMYLSGASNIKINGITMGYALQSSGQIHVVKKLGGDKLLVVPAAGYENIHTKENGGFYDWFTQLEDGSTALYPIANISHTIVENGDGTATLTLTGNDTKEYFNFKVGDIITCRIPGSNKFSIGIDNSSGVNFRDIVLYGYSAAVAYRGAGDNSDISFNRWHNTVHSAPVIDENTYEKYEEWQKEYNVDLEIYVDENGNYRGSLPRVGSVDATHVMGCTEGITVESSILESMTDDGSNHRSSSSRLHDIIDNEDGTAMIYYKSNLSEYYHKNYGTLSNTTNFSKGDRIFIVTSSGEIVCDTECLGDAKKTSKTVSFSYDDKNYTSNIYYVKVDIDDINFDAISDYDLSDNSYDFSKKVLVDNLSRNSVGFTFDNVVIQNTRSRGILVKTRDADIKHCTFRNLAHTGILMSVEPVWGESTLAQNVKVTACLFDHVGYIDRLITRSDLTPIAIIGFGETVTADKEIACRNIVIDGCTFINNENIYTITVQAAQDVTIKNNTFGLITQNGRETLGVSVFIKNSKNVELSDNTYPSKADSVTDTVKGSNYLNVFGTDTEDESGNSLFPDCAN